MVKFLGPSSPTDGSFNARTYGAKGDGTVDDAPAIQKAIDAASASLQGSTPTFVAAGTVSSGTTTAAPGVPAGYAANDVFLMFVESNFDQPVTPPTGWAVVDGFPQANTTNTLASQLSAFWKRAAASESAPTVADPGDHVVARIFAFRGCRTYGVPWDGVATTVTNSAGTTLTCPTLTTSVTNNLIVNVASTGVDPASDSTTTFSAWTNASLGSVTERGDNDVAAGAGGGFGVATGTLAVPGATGTTTTLTTSTWSVTGTIALAPTEAPGGSVVVIPPGNYRLNSQLNLKSNMTLIAHGAYLWTGAANYLLVCNYGGAWGFNGGHNIEVHGGIWDGKAQDQAAEAAYNVMGFYHCSNIGVHDLSIRNVASWHGFEYNSTQNSIIERVRFEGFRDTTAALSRQFSASIQIDLATNDLTCSKNITVKDCYSGPSADGSGLGVFGRGFDSHNDTLGKWYTGIKILNNTIEGTIQQGIQTYSWNDSIVSGNIIRNTGLTGIRVAGNAANDVKNITITNNVISTPGSSGIDVTVVGTRILSNSTISSNIISDCGLASATPAIFPRFTKSLTIANNSITNSANIGISIFDSTSITVTGNSIYTSGNDGIRLNQNCINAVVSNNVVDTCIAGIYITGTGCSYCTVIGNLFINCTTNTTPAAAMEVSSTAGNDHAFMGNRIVKGTGTATAAFKHIAGATQRNIVLMGNAAKGWNTAYASAYIVVTSTDITRDDIDTAATANYTIL